jgi:hypothetical protein
LDASIDAEVHHFFLAGEAALSDRLRYKARKGNDNDQGHREVVLCDALFDASASSKEETITIGNTVRWTRATPSELRITKVRHL